MKDTLEIFTEQGIDCLKHANMIANIQQHKKIQADDLFWGVYCFIKEYSYYPLFCALIGIHQPKKIDSFFSRTLKKKSEKSEKRSLSAYLYQSLEKEYHRQHFLIEPLQLLGIARGGLSESLKKSLQLEDSYEHIAATLQKLSSSSLIREKWFISFLEHIDMMLKDMQIDQEALLKMDILGLGLPSWAATQDSMESEIVEKSDSDGVSLDAKGKDPKKKEEKKLTIDYFGTDLTKEAKDGYIDPIIGREKEIDQVIYTLLRKTKNNPLLIGEAGVGKTAIVEGLVQRINAGKVPEKILNKRVFLLDMGTLVAGTKYRGEFESRMKSILEEATDPTNNIILFIDELHTIIGAGGQDQNDAAQMLKPLLSRGKIKLIGATTFDEYQKYIEKDAALKRRFQEVVVNEPDIDTTKQIILGLKKTYEDFHGVSISDEAIDSSIQLSKRYILNKQLPDKALDIIDEASARKSTMQKKLDNDVSYKKEETKIEKLHLKIEKAIEGQDYFSAAELKAEEEELKKKLQKIRANKNIPAHLRSIISAGDIGAVLADKTGIPTDIVNEDEISKLKRLDTNLKGQIIGQDDAVDAVVKTLVRSRLSVIRKDKPIGSFLFLGPSGVGKTFLAKLIAKNYFGDETALIRFDMSEFMEKFSVSKLIGSPAGYVGYDEGGGLTEAVKRKPYSVVLLDEIEKASPDVLNILLQILDEGQLKDSKGRWIDFKNTIIVMTSNIWTEEFSKKKSSIWFDVGDQVNIDEKHFDQVKSRVLDELKNFLTPELSNRIDHKIVFKPLSKTNLELIFTHQIKKFLAAWKENKEVKLPSFTKKDIKDIVEKIYDPQFGARPVERYINDEVEPSIINTLLNK